jgi:FtsH-binding integral membrane protein
VENSTPIDTQINMSDRSSFITKTYMTLLMAILAFVGLEVLYFQTGLAETIAHFCLDQSWLVILGAFILVGYLASHFAHTLKSKKGQYLALSFYVLAESLIFVPLLYLAQRHASGGVLESASLITGFGFLGLTLVAFLTRKDFSFLKGILLWGGVLALVAIIAGSLFGFVLGTYFSLAMIGLAGAAVLYDTSNVIHNYPEEQYIGAALELFSSITMMLWYTIRFFMSRD